MKLRLTHNSIRIRIQRSELAQLQETGSIRNTVSFPASTAFHFEIVIHQMPEVQAINENARISIRLPHSIAQTWFNTTQVGIESHLSLQGDDLLHVLIEKDFPCADRPNEDKSETFWELVDKPDPAC